MSNRLKALQEKRGKTVDSMESLLETAKKDADRDLTDVEKKAFEDFEAELKSIDEAVEFEKKVEAAKAKNAKPLDIPGNGQASKTAAAARSRYGKLKSFKNDDAGIEAAYRSGQFVLATIFGNEKAAEWCRENGITIQKAQSESVNTAGGFLVPTEFSQAIIDLREQYGTFRRSTMLVPMGSDSMSIPRRAGGLTAYWVGENTAVTESTKQWGQVNLVAKKLAALAKMSSELSEDAVISIADDLANEMAYAFAKAEDAAGWNGDGTSNYGGVIGARTKIIDGTHTKSAIDAASGHDTFAEIDANDLAAVMAACPLYALANAKWYCSSVAWALVFQRLIAAAGGVTMGELTGGKPTKAYLGYPVEIDQTLPMATTDISDTAMLFFGDLRLAATMGERRGITIKSSEERYFELDQVAVLGTERVDINVHDLGDNTNAGPLIALIGE
jgi:HK97 family phage major capsid protein